MRTFRLLGLFVALAFFVPACGNSSPTDVPAGPDPALDFGAECELGERDPQTGCAFSGFIGSGG